MRPALLYTLLLTASYGLLLALAPGFGPSMPGWQRVLIVLAFAVAWVSAFALLACVLAPKPPINPGKTPH